MDIGKPIQCIHSGKMFKTLISIVCGIINVEPILVVVSRIQSRANRLLSVKLLPLMAVALKYITSR